MEKEDNYSAAPVAPPSLGELDYSNATTHQQHHQQMMMMMAATTAAANDVSTGHVGDYMLSNPPPGPTSDHYGPSFSSFADVMQFADFGPKLALHNPSRGYQAEHGGVDPVYMLKFPVLNENHHHGDSRDDEAGDGGDGGVMRYEEDHQESNANEPVVQLEFLGGSGSLNQMMMLNNTGSQSDPVVNQNNNNNNNNNNKSGSSKRKRARSVKTTEEVESQRMTHIAVERNRRKQMNEHLRVLRSLMPSSYVQRGDQASIIGGAIEFVRELEQLLQCLESQKRRRLYGDGPGGGGTVLPLPLPSNDPTFGSNSNDPNNDNPAMASKLVDLDGVMAMTSNSSGLQEETAESKSSIADVEVRLTGFDAFIKILSRRRPGQLIKAISAIQDLQFTILHTNITTIEQTVLYSFNIKVCSDSRFSADDIASSVQQIFTFIHANTPI